MAGNRETMLDESVSVTFAELQTTCGLSREELRELVELGVFEPVGGVAEWTFAAQALPRARAAGRLMRDFDLNLSGLALALSLIDRIEGLERQLRELECHLLR